MMQRYKCVVIYDGSSFSGYQDQPNKRTVQMELEQALTKLHKGEPIKVFASGRTDAGVHARGQVIHFDSRLKIEPPRWEIALNSLLPNEIAIHQVEVVPQDFHARFDTVGKEYRYFIHRSTKRDPFKRHYAYQFPYGLDISAMKEAANLMIGTHDFTSFCSAKTEVEDRVREVMEIELLEEEDLLILRFVGSGFLYNMVRIMVGTLLQVGSGDIPAQSIPGILAKKDRKYAGKTAPGQGLYLWKVFYEEDHLPCLPKKNSYDN